MKPIASAAILPVLAFATVTSLHASPETPAEVRARAWCPDNGDGSFTNPIMWGDWPDPDVIRVDDEFYFISTSMHYVPGCPIAKSKDLVNWEMAGYAVDRYDEDPRYDMQGGQLYLNGSWATAIRHHNGKFYVGFCTPYGHGTKTGHFSMCVADDVRGPWKRTIFPEYLYDPGLLFDDDGKVYVAHGQGTTYVTELAADALSVKGENVKVFSGAGAEGSHFYKINGKYYILQATGGSGGSQICLRSDRVYGPYESKEVVNDRSSYPPNGLHQGGMVQLKNGDWWTIIMQDRGPIGRVPHLVPVKWVDGWPMLGENGEGKGVVTCKKPATGPAQPITAPATSDEFNATSLGLQWQWNHNPDNTRWSLTERPGFLRLKAGKATDLLSARNTLTQRVQGPESEAIVALDPNELKDGDTAGLAIFEQPYGYVAIRRENGKLHVVMNRNGKDRADIPDFTGKVIWFKASVTHQGFQARFAYSADGTDFKPLGGTLGMGLGFPWTANRFALFHFSSSDAGVGGIADFDSCRIRMSQTIPLSDSGFGLTASSEQSDNTAANAMDEDSETRWCADSADKGQWLQVELDRPRKVAKADITWESRGDYQASIEASNDGKSWQPLPGDGRFVRITVTAMPPGQWASIREIRLMDAAGDVISKTPPMSRDHR